MAGWFARLMQRGHARSRRSVAAAGVSGDADAGTSPGARDTRYDAIVRMLRDREVEDRAAREKRQRGYRQSVESDPSLGSDAPGLSSPTRLYRFRTKVPCRATAEAHALLRKLGKRFPGGTVTFPQVTSRRHAVMLTARAGTEPKQIGWVEHCVQTDPTRCNVRDQGLVVETDGDRMLVLQFRYPPTATRVSSRHDAEEATRARGSGPIDGRSSAPPGGDGLELPSGAIDEVVNVDFAEIRTALDPRPSDRAPAPRLVWVTRREAETMDALRSRDYEGFYLRFKLEVLAGIWSSLSGQLASSPGARWHQGSYYAVVREADATSGKIHQRTVDDSGRVVDIGSDRTYDAAPATDILLLYLEGDILADFADIYFTLQSFPSADAYFLKEEFFTVIRRFWAGAQSLASRYGSDPAAVVRMAQRAVPIPEEPLLRQDWTSLRQSLVDRYGEGGRKAADLVGQEVHRRRIGPLGWPFASFPAGEIDVGLRLVYRQEWRPLGARRGEIVRMVPPPPAQTERGSAGSTPGAKRRRAAHVETIVAQGDGARSLGEVVDEAVRATVDAMRWPRDLDGSIDTGVRSLVAKTDMGLESECRESSRDTSTRLGEIMRRMASKARDETAVAASAEPEGALEPSSSSDPASPTGGDAATHVYSRLQQRYEVVTRPVELQNVVLVAERLPMPAEIGLSWVRRHDWILAKVLLDESFRDALETIGQEARMPDSSERLPHDLELDAKRDRLFEHLRANILHYQRAIWQREDPQQRSMRYRKSGKKVPLEWRFELESGGALTIDELADRLAAANVDGQFAAYSEGRQADLDQVIDPAGPIGYYGNYAVYHMRPELGGEDLFSMLHFFKSPYLRPHPETGEPEVEDPEQIRLCEDPAVVSASDRVIDQHRDGMFEYVPELRLELARARKKVSDGTDPDAVDRLKWQRGTLRRHFATYLFRRERARRIVLDTDGLVIDVIRSADPAADVEHTDGAAGRGEAPEGSRLMLESAGGLEPLRASDRRDAGAGWAILRDDEARMPTLVAGAGAPPAHVPALGPAIVAGGDAARTIALPAGRAHDAEGGRVILARHDGGARMTAVHGGAPPGAAVWAAVAAGDAERTAGLLAGSARDPETARVIPARAEGALRVTLVRDGGASRAYVRAIVPAGVDVRTARLRVGWVRGPEAGRVILARDDEQRTSGLLAGGGAPGAGERVILARAEGASRLTAAAAGGAPRAHERAILAGDGALLRPSLVAE